MYNGIFSILKYVHSVDSTHTAHFFAVNNAVTRNNLFVRICFPKKTIRFTAYSQLSVTVTDFLVTIASPLHAMFLFNVKWIQFSVYIFFSFQQNEVEIDKTLYCPKSSEVDGLFNRYDD